LASLSLAAADFERIVTILAAMPDFRTVQNRVDLLTDDFAGCPRGDLLAAGRAVEQLV